jgi:hypothetical protein
LSVLQQRVAAMAAESTMGAVARDDFNVASLARAAAGGVDAIQLQLERGGRERALPRADPSRRKILQISPGSSLVGMEHGRARRTMAERQQHNVSQQLCATPFGSVFCDGFTSPIAIEQYRLVDNGQVWLEIRETGTPDA